MMSAPGHVVYVLGMTAKATLPRREVDQRTL
jgi:hypothetical protein